nr:MAG TPA: peptidase [Microviridae sp.]
MAIYFNIEEMIKSETAEKKGIDNGFPSIEALCNAFKVLERLDLVRAHMDKPIFINSGYRCKELNKAVRGAENSYHMKGLAADFRTDNKEDIPRMYNFLQRNIKRFNIQELIKYDTFIHMAIKP